jgi:zinc D-Ala-D-Ala carboxypeptidase
MRYFTLDEFDSPDLPGSGAFMHQEFLDLLDDARDLAGVPFVINSGYRTEYWNQKVGGRVGSSHLTGWAADIRATTSNRRYLVVAALTAVGFTRIGCADSFVHVDMDPTKAENCLWLY